MSGDYKDHRIAVIGAGVMGTNIAATALGHGVDVLLVDIDQEVLDQGRLTTLSHVRHAQLMGALPAERPTGTLTTSLTTESAAGSTAVVEAVVEAPDVKAKVLAELSDVVDPGTPIITNTSGIPIDELADRVARPAELLGTHFMNPTYLIKMVEVVRGPRTDDAVMESVGDLLTAMGRQAVVVSDAPGFVTSRLLHPMLNNAARIVGAGTATAEAVDLLMTGCLGHATGPLRTADLIGLDNLVDSLRELHERTGDESCRPCDRLLELVEAGHLGRKSGRGFYDYGKALS